MTNGFPYHKLLLTSINMSHITLIVMSNMTQRLYFCVSEQSNWILYQKEIQLAYKYIQDTKWILKFSLTNLIAILVFVMICCDRIINCRWRFSAGNIRSSTYLGPVYASWYDLIRRSWDAGSYWGGHFARLAESSANGCGREIKM